MAEPTIERMIEELWIAGWVREFSTVWKSPSGSLFLGPVLAWRKMMTHPHLNVCTPKREVSIRPEHEQEGLG